MNHLKRIFISMLLIAFLAFVGFFIYTLDYYRADDVALSALVASQNTLIEVENSLVTFKPEESSGVGIIFYPGGKVEHIAYAPLCSELAQNNSHVFLVKMPFNLAVFDINRADVIIDANPEITRWYIAGHSLGGAMASQYTSENSQRIEGVILLGAYASGDLSKTDSQMLSVYGSEDKILNQDSFTKTQTNNPPRTIYHEIAGGNHAYFGSYGEQKGDGSALINPEKQRSETVKTIMAFIDP
ncbi:MAG: alpha/beta hydrolase [Eubacteriales bacterium]|nr:alpha/beta hydrolase [Eubacteriales bacterium]